MRASLGSPSCLSFYLSTPSLFYCSSPFLHLFGDQPSAPSPPLPLPFATPHFLLFLYYSKREAVLALCFFSLSSFTSLLPVCFPLFLYLALQFSLRPFVSLNLSISLSYSHAVQILSVCYGALLVYCPMLFKPS